MTQAKTVTIDCEYLRPGLAAAYLRVQDGEAGFVEANAAPAVPRLLAALEAEGLRPEDVRWVLVTHAHLDHAGGASALLSRLPRATLLAHPRAARHLIDPSRLVASAQAVYGPARFEELYGTLSPIDPSRVRALSDGETLSLGGATLRALHTRGHANHHLVLHDPSQGAVFTGDAFGLVYPSLQHSGRFALPSTSPTDFDGPAARDALDAILSTGAERALLTHFGEVRDLTVVASQLRSWLLRSEALVSAAAALPPSEALPWLLAREGELLEDHAREAGLALTDEDRALLALDVDLNAQGLAFAAAKARPTG